MSFFELRKTIDGAMENAADAQTARHCTAGLRRSAVVTSSSSVASGNLHGHEFREILDTAFQAPSDVPVRAAEILGKSLIALYLR